MSVMSETSIDEVYSFLATKTGLSILETYLTFRGKILEANSTLKDYEITKNSTLVSYLRHC